jgi:hypothetical protein
MSEELVAEARIPVQSQRTLTRAIAAPMEISVAVEEPGVVEAPSITMVRIEGVAAMAQEEIPVTDSTHSRRRMVMVSPTML